MRINHNISALNTYNKLGASDRGNKKTPAEFSGSDLVIHRGVGLVDGGLGRAQFDPGLIQFSP